MLHENKLKILCPSWVGSIHPVGSVPSQETFLGSEMQISEIRAALSAVTIEPIIFVMSLGQSIPMITQNQMIIYKACRQEEFNLTKEFCENIGVRKHIPNCTLIAKRTKTEI